ncbi:reverse transcriptase-like protein [Candidatus Saccharibacteria bacterium]|nr:reverse transcriptase-like protein [Candidatus Saccharibacteria bacterium]
MKQRIRVVGIIRGDSGVLVLKRNRGRLDAPVFWELPTGKIKFGEQPEEAMARLLNEYVDLTAKTIGIKDAITFVAPEGSSRLNNLYIVYEITILDHQKPNPHDRYTSYKYIKDVASSNIRLNEASLSVLEIIEGETIAKPISPRDTASSVTVYVDGASRGNPGPSGVGYYIVNTNGEVIERGGSFIGFATSRVAEYQAMKNGIERALALNLKSARFMSDSLMVVNQLNNTFTIKNRDIIPIYNSIQKLLENFDSVSFTHIPRVENKIADAEANKAINDILKK